MPVQTLYQESLVQENFYTPRFEVRIQGVGLPRNVLRDVVSITYHDSVKELDSFDLTVNNWDADTHKFKYVGSETQETLAAGHPLSGQHKLFEPCGKDVEIRMGFVGELTLMVKGNFTSMEPKFTASAAPTLTVRGLNVLHKLRTKQFTYAWTNLKDSQIALNLRTLRDPRGGPRFPLPIQTDPGSLANEPELPYVAEHNQYDIDFLMTRARQRGYVIYVIPDPTGRTPGTLYFGPRGNDSNAPAALRDVQFQLHWGRSLIEFKPTMTTATQVKSVTVNGWNRRTRRAISETATLDDARINCNRDIHRLLQQCDPRQEVVVTEPVFTPRQAKERALAILNERQHDFVKCEATTVGLPDLRAGLKIDIQNVGARFSGEYFITETTHTINDSGYTTQFKAQRDDPREGAMRMNGVVIGTVTDVNDPLGEGRIQLRFPWMADEIRSDWAPVAAPMAGPSRGAFLMPEVDDEVLVAFEHGDFDHPFVLGFLWNGVDTPPETDPQNRVILTPGGHTIRFEDADPKKLIVRSSSGHEILLDDSAGAAMIRLQTAAGLKITMDDVQQSIELNGGGRILALKAGQVQIT